MFGQMKIKVGVLLLAGCADELEVEVRGGARGILGSSCEYP